MTPDGTVTLTQTVLGLCVIEASQIGNDNYNAATPVDQSFKVVGYVEIIRSGQSTIYYGTIQKALDNFQNDDIIGAEEVIPSEDINFNPVISASITFQGGLALNFVPQAGRYTSVKSVTTTNGSITVDGLLIQ